MIGVPIARIGGIEIRVQIGWIFVVALVAVLAVGQVAGAVPELSTPIQWFLGAVVGVAFFVSAMAHDLAHALVARRRGIDVRSVVVSFFGGTTPTDPRSEVARDELAIAVSGPIVSLLVGLGLGALGLAIGGGRSGIARAVGEILIILAVLNLLIGLVNVIPAYPMDGGRAVRAAAWARTGSVRRGSIAAATSGRLSGLLVIAIGAFLFATGEISNGAMVALSGWFLVLSSRAIRERMKVDDLIGGLTIGDAMERNPASVNPGLTVDTMAGQLLDPESPTTAVAVVEGEAVVGIVGVRDVRRLRRAMWPTKRVGDVMVAPPRLQLLGSGQTLLEGVDRLQGSGLDGLPVVDDGRLVGILTRRAIGDAVREKSGATASSGRRGRF
ncbi:MAG: CBS domain-containing protein [Chloroflexi bacterium]|nr:CBS domain-containing protein [Chloroflexota bacterium]